MTDDRSSQPTTVAECRQAIRLHEWELLRLIQELAERRRETATHRRAFNRGRKTCARIWRKCCDRAEQIELMRDIIRSSPDGRTVETGQAIESIPAGVAVLERLGEMLGAADPETEEGLRDFFRQLADFQEFAKDFFDYAGVKLVYELGELLSGAEKAAPGKLGDFFQRVGQLRETAEDWYE